MGSDVDDEQVSVFLTMVSYSAQQLCPVEWEDGFEEYAELVTATSRVPGAGPEQADGSSAGVVDAGVFLGVGLALLGQVAFHVLVVLADLGVEKIAEAGAGRLRARLRRGKDSQSGENRAAGGVEVADIDVAALADQVAAKIAPAIIASTPQVSIEVVQTAVRILMEGLASSGTGPRTRERRRGRR